MENSFFGFYNPSSEQFDKLWREGTIVFDANAILDLYRLPPKARDELFTALEYFKDRLWLPYQVALEYQRNRFTVIADRRTTTSAVLSTAAKLLTDLKASVAELKLDQYEAGFNSDDVLKEINPHVEKILAAIQDVQKNELDVSHSDPIRDRLDAIFAGKVGQGPQSKSDMDALISDAEVRFDAKQPPGFEDEKRKNKAKFVHDGLVYTNCYGDLILWRQIIRHAKSNNIKHLLFVTRDKKEDWWWKEGKKRIGPHQELVREIRREGGVETFWMLTPDRFLAQSAEYSKKTVSTDSVSELNLLTKQQPTFDLNDELLASLSDANQSFRGQSTQALEDAFLKWLTAHAGDVRVREKFPSFLAWSGGTIRAYHVVPWRKGMMGRSLRAALTRAKSVLNVNHIRSMCIVIVVPEGDEAPLETVSDMIDGWRHNFKDVDIMVGSVDPLGSFHSLVTYPAWQDELEDEN